MDKDSKILIAVPSMDYVAAGFAQSLATLNKVGKCAVSFLCGSLIYDSRNRLASQALHMEADYIMWFDSDMIFGNNTMKALMDVLDQNGGSGVVSGLYFRRSSPYTPVAFQDLEVTEDNKAKWSDYKGELTGVHEVGGVGFGCVLMSTDVVLEVLGKYGTAFSPIAGLGEDLSFCWRARQLGHKILLDTDVKCGHMGHVVVTEDLFKAVSGGEYDESKS